MSSNFPVLNSEGDEIFWAYNRHSVETVTLRKYLAVYEHMRKWIFEFLSKFQVGGIWIARVNSIRVATLLHFFNSLRAVNR